MGSTVSISSHTPQRTWQHNYKRPRTQMDTCDVIKKAFIMQAVDGGGGEMRNEVMLDG